MADCTVSDIYGDVRGLLGDSGAEVFDDTMLAVPFGQAYRELHDCLINNGLPPARREAYPVLPAYTGVLVPAAFNITDLDEPVEVWERGNVSSVAISTLTNATPIVVTTASAHGITANTEVTIYGVSTPSVVNDNWWVSVPAADQLALNGSVASGAYGAGGYVAWSSEHWVICNSVDTISQVAPSSRIKYWQWEQNRFNFRPSTEQRQLKIVYWASGTAPSSGSIGIDNARSFLAVATAYRAAQMRDMTSRAQELKLEAYGPEMVPNVSGGALRALVNPMVKEMQKRPARPQTFRPRRNAMWRTFW